MKQTIQELLSISEIKNIDDSIYISGYYDDKFFVLVIEHNDFTLGYDDTECTDEELKSIFDFVINSELLDSK